jgi:hemolysin III
MLAGGISYSLGTIFFSWRRLPFSHGLWHLFVLGGSFCHFWGIFVYI